MNGWFRGKGNERRPRTVGTWAAALVLAAVLLLSLGSLAACGTSATAGGDGAGQKQAASGEGAALKLTEADTGKSFNVAVGQTITVTIAGNPTTGFSWQYDEPDPEAALLDQQGEAVYTPGGTALGAGGTYLFTFKAVATGDTTLTLNYLKTFENNPPEKTFSVKLTIK